MVSEAESGLIGQPFSVPLAVSEGEQCRARRVRECEERNGLVCVCVCVYVCEFTAGWQRIEAQSFHRETSPILCLSTLLVFRAPV